MGFLFSDRQTGICVQVKGMIIAFVRYMFAGGVGFLIDYSILALFYEVCGCHYLLSSAMGFVCGLIFVYVASNRWVFSNRKMQHHQVVEFVIFSIIGLVGLLLTMLFMWLFTDVCAIHVLISKLLTTALVLMWNFGARKFILY